MSHRLLSSFHFLLLLFSLTQSTPVDEGLFNDRMRQLDQEIEIELKKDSKERYFVEGRIEEIEEAKSKIISTIDGKTIEEEDDGYTGPYAKNLYQGDIMLTQSELPFPSIHLNSFFSDQLEQVTSKKTSRNRRQAQKNSLYPSNLWKNDPIPYTFDPRFPKSRIPAVRAAIEYWERNTCIRFAENATGKDRIRFINGNGCWSMIGKTGGEQFISIGYGCDWIGTIAHELEHAFGVWHTQARPDRGYYLAVNAWNILSYQLHNFDTQALKNVDLLGIPYEFGSVMHYFQNDFAIDRSKPTLVTRTGYERFQESMSNYLPSFYDIRLINTYYQCYDKCPSKLSCLNGGIQDVNNCDQCKCPPGYNGNNCEQITISWSYLLHVQSTTGCDKFLSIGSSPVNLNATAGSDGLWSLTYEHCAIHLQATDPKKRIELSVTTRGGFTSWNCYGAGVDIRLMKDPAMSGVRLCRPNTIFDAVYSDADHMVLSLFARVNYVDFSFSARSI
ncbi:hypothetical protein PRIPAC_82761 [Pristionchus pacificus]|uniref:Zinc metalloproteinase n=1 Tax=Pristionchus pacificus TaxID=54126 RepID=A0A2A6CAW7_PRIPA|nr:hypothetical protein PRIPAC_82761 [Pristionchus pacificus]|eukprot:PDM75246.1 metallopeptidase [Pristionchus pacificus]